MAEPAAVPGPGIQVEEGISLAGRGVLARAKGLVQVEPVEGHPSAPAGVERLGEENSVARTNHGFLIIGVSDAQSRRKPFLPGFLRKLGAEAGRTAGRA